MLYDRDYIEWNTTGRPDVATKLEEVIDKMGDKEANIL